MATDKKEFVSLDSLLDFLGVDEDSSAIVAGLRESSLEELSRATGIDWAEQRRHKVAEELIQLMVYLAYYGQRGGIQNTDYLEKRRTQLMLQLQYAPEVTAHDEAPLQYKG